MHPQSDEFQHCDTCIIAIDGRAAAGKTTLAQKLAKSLGGSIIHMDDFFLPAHLRTASRLAEPGGNVHYERFLEEVVPFLVGGKNFRPFSYQIFDCKTMSFAGTRTLKNLPLIVEGTYSCHPIFGDYMDIKLFADISPTKQMARLTAREGASAAELFKNKWIPLEERYFGTYFN